MDYKRKLQATDKKWKSYADYLKSTEWKVIKADYKEMFLSSECIVCSADEEKLHHHHWNYPKDWNDDSSENLIHVCKDCHKHIHEYGVLDGDDFTCRDDYLIKLLKYFVMLYKQNLECEAEGEIECYENFLFKLVFDGAVKLSTRYEMSRPGAKLAGCMYIDNMRLLGPYRCGLERRIKEALNA